MNIRVDTILPPPPEPTKTVVITMPLYEAYDLMYALQYHQDEEVMLSKLYHALSIVVPTHDV